MGHTGPVSDRRQRGWVLAATGMLLVSTDSYFIRRADFDAWTIACVFGIASAVTLTTIFAVTTDASPAAAFTRAPLALLSLAVLSSATQLAFTGAVNNTSVANVVVIVGSTPVLASLFAWHSLRERTDRRVLIAIAMTLVGIIVVVSGSFGAPTLDGDMLAVLAIVFVSVSLVIWRRHPEINRPLALALSSATMAIVAAPLASLGDAPVRVFVAAGLMGLLFNPIGRVSYTSATRYAPTAEVALFTPIETIAATAWAWLFFAERPSTQTVVGGVIVIVAVLWGTLGRRVAFPRVDPVT